MTKASRHLPGGGGFDARPDRLEGAHLLPQHHVRMEKGSTKIEASRQLAHSVVGRLLKSESSFSSSGSRLVKLVLFFRMVIFINCDFRRLILPKNIELFSYSFDAYRCAMLRLKKSMKEERKKGTMNKYPGGKKVYPC